MLIVTHSSRCWWLWSFSCQWKCGGSCFHFLSRQTSLSAPIVVSTAWYSGPRRTAADTLQWREGNCVHREFTCWIQATAHGVVLIELLREYNNGTTP
jgi:hypothetical protein